MEVLDLAAPPGGMNRENMTGMKRILIPALALFLLPSLGWSISKEELEGCLHSHPEMEELIVSTGKLAEKRLNSETMRGIERGWLASIESKSCDEAIPFLKERLGKLRSAVDPRDNAMVSTEECLNADSEFRKLSGEVEVLARSLLSPSELMGNHVDVNLSLLTCEKRVQIYMGVAKGLKEKLLEIQSATEVSGELSAGSAR